MSRVFTLSDAHRFHDFVARLRGYPSTVEHDAALDDELRSTLRPRDNMWWLGDMTGGGRIPAMLDWIRSLPGTHHLVAGNHCPVHPMHSGSHKRQRAYLTAFASVQPFARRKIGGRRVVLSHFPIVGDHTDEPRFDQWRLRPFPGTLLHGHTHSTEKASAVGETLQIHVGVDAWGLRPVGDEEILALIEEHRPR